jgi:hypothetical protein
MTQEFPGLTVLSVSLQSYFRKMSDDEIKRMLTRLIERLEYVRDGRDSAGTE